MTNLLPGMRVRFARPRTQDEALERFVVLELRDQRVLVALECDLSIKPTFVYLASDLIKADAQGDI